MTDTSGNWQIESVTNHRSMAAKAIKCIKSNELDRYDKLPKYLESNLCVGCCQLHSNELFDTYDHNHNHQHQHHKNHHHHHQLQPQNQHQHPYQYQRRRFKLNSTCANDIRAIDSSGKGIATKLTPKSQPLNLRATKPTGFEALVVVTGETGENSSSHCSATTTTTNNNHNTGNCHCKASSTPAIAANSSSNSVISEFEGNFTTSTPNTRVWSLISGGNSGDCTEVADISCRNNAGNVSLCYPAGYTQPNHYPHQQAPKLSNSYAKTANYPDCIEETHLHKQCYQQQQQQQRYQPQPRRDPQKILKSRATPASTPTNLDDYDTTKQVAPSSLATILGEPQQQQQHYQQPSNSLIRRSFNWLSQKGSSKRLSLESPSLSPDKSDRSSSKLITVRNSISPAAIASESTAARIQNETSKLESSQDIPKLADNLLRFRQLSQVKSTVNRVQTDDSAPESSDPKPSTPVSDSSDHLEKVSQMPKQINWKQIAHRYGRATTTSQTHRSFPLESDQNQQKPPRDNHRDHLNPSDDTETLSYNWKIGHSCFCHLLATAFHSLFPIFHAFNGYSLPGDLISDILAGLTIAIFQIPQGMAYGLLAGVEPINGLYVSLVPVFIMAIMSRSKHVSYGTFAVTSMMMAGAIERTKATIRDQIPSSQLQSLSESIGSIETGSAKLQPPLGTLDSVDKHKLSQTLRPGKIIQNLNIDSNGETSPLMSSGQIIGASEIQLNSGHQAWSQSFGFESDTNFVMPSNIEILTSICITVGLIQLFMAIIRLGVLSLVFSDQLVSSFTTASAVHVITSQIGQLFDLTLPSVSDGIFRVCRTWWVFIQQILHGFNHVTGLLSLVSIIFLLVFKEIIEPRLKRRFKFIKCFPSELILMSTLIFASWYWQFNEKYNISVVGQIPSGLPPIKQPRLDLLILTLEDSISIALVSFAMNLSLAQMYAKQHRYKINPNQELFALGTTNIISSFFTCFPCASSISRSVIQTNLGPKSPLAPLFSCGIVLMVTCYFASILHDLPRSSLSCIIVVALMGVLRQFKDLRDNFRLSKLDSITWLITFIAVIAFGVTYGLLVGIVSSLIIVFLR